MAEVGPGIPSWDEAMRHAAAWLAKLEKDSGKKLAVVVEADAAAAKAWLAFAAELTNRSRSGPFDTQGSR